MSTDLNVVPLEDQMEDIVSAIQGKYWKYVKKDFDLLQLVTCLGQSKMGLNKYVINDKVQLQCRDKSLDYEFVDRQVGKVKNKGDKTVIKNPVLVYFPNPIEYEGVEFPSNSYGLVDDAHGTLIKVRLNIVKYDAYYVNFDIHLDSTKSNIRALGNMLNRQWKETQGVTIAHLRTEYHQLIDEAIANRLPDGVPTEEQNLVFLRRYGEATGINRKSLGQFKSGHKKIGGRSKRAIKKYTPDMLDEELKKVQEMEEYKDKGYVILCRTVGAYDGEGLGYAFKTMTKEKKTKTVMILYADSETQASGFENTESDPSGDWSKKRLQLIADDWGSDNGKEFKLIFLDPR